MTALSDRRVRAWDTRSGRRLAGSFEHTVPVWHVASTFDGDLVASAAVGRGGDDVRDVVVNGRIVMRDRRVLTLNENAVLDAAAAWAAKVRQAVQQEQD